MLRCLLALALLSASASAARADTCMRLDRGGSTRFYPVDDHTILVSVGLRAYRVTTVPSPPLTDPAAVIETDYSLSTVVCSAASLKLAVSLPHGRAELMVESIETLSSEEAAKLRRGGPHRH